MKIYRTTVKIALVAAVMIIVAVGAPEMADTRGRCPNGTAFIEGGDFISGVSSTEAIYLFKLCQATMGGCYQSWFQREVPPKRVITKSFCIDEYEFPNIENAVPQTNVTWNDARAACYIARKRLCTEHEWERACRGTSYLEWSYGYKYLPGVCNERTESVTPSGRRSGCESQEGVLDLNGNVSEWVDIDDEFSGGVPLPPGYKLAKGGNYRDWPVFTRCSFRDFRSGNERSHEIGFRCCSSPYF